MLLYHLRCARRFCTPRRSAPSWDSDPAALGRFDRAGPLSKLAGGFMPRECVASSSRLLLRGGIRARSRDPSGTSDVVRNS
jgi:hypothetical protein